MLPPEELAQIQISQHPRYYLPFRHWMGKATEMTTAAQHGRLADFPMGACNYAYTKSCSTNNKASPRARRAENTTTHLPHFPPAVTFCTRGTNETQSFLLLLLQAGHFPVDSHQLGLVQRHIAGFGSRVGTNSSSRKREGKMRAATT